MGGARVTVRRVLARACVHVPRRGCRTRLPVPGTARPLIVELPVGPPDVRLAREGTCHGGLFTE